jgi:hypothetical protein
MTEATISPSQRRNRREAIGKVALGGRDLRWRVFVASWLGVIGAFVTGLVTNNELAVPISFVVIASIADLAAELRRRPRWREQRLLVWLLQEGRKLEAAVRARRDLGEETDLDRARYTALRRAGTPEETEVAEWLATAEHEPDLKTREYELGVIALVKAELANAEGEDPLPHFAGAAATIGPLPLQLPWIVLLLVVRFFSLAGYLLFGVFLYLLMTLA